MRVTHLNRLLFDFKTSSIYDFTLKGGNKFHTCKKEQLKLQVFELIIVTNWDGRKEGLMTEVYNNKRFQGLICSSFLYECNIDLLLFSLSIRTVPWFSVIHITVLVSTLISIVLCLDKNH